MRSLSSGAGALAAAALALWSAVAVVDARLAPDIVPFGEMAFGDFAPLTCNGAMNAGTFSGCVLYSAQGYDLTGQVTVPCGTCVDVDVPSGTTLHFEGGLDIEGALRFPKNWKGTVRAPFIYVQGHLVIDNDLPVSVGNIDGLTFILEGTVDQAFFPNVQNTAACRGSSCDVGKKAFVVAGGQLHVTAFPDTCPTWVKLLNVEIDNSAADATTYPVPPTPQTGCSATILGHDFETGYGPFKAGLGSEESLVPSGSHDGSTSFLVTDRQKTWQGPFVDFTSDNIKDCVVANQTYLLHAKAKIAVDPAATSEPYSSCHVNGTDCLALILHTANEVADSTPALAWRTLSQIQPSQKTTDGQWFDFTAEFEFTDAELDAATSLYQMMYFGGPELGVTIEIDDVAMILPSADMFPDPTAGSVCTDLVVNGDAESSPYHKFPWEFIGNQHSSVTVTTETDATTGNPNNYFAIRGRNATWTSINVELINDCIVRNSQYTFSLKLRLHSAEERDVRIVLKSYPLDPPDTPPLYVTSSVGACEGLSSANGWVTCTRQFQFREEHETATKIELSLVVPDDKVSNLDVDDVTVTRYAPPLDRFVVADSVVPCWGQNATILQTSHTLSHDDENVLQIESVTDNGDGTATIKTYTPVAKPTTAADDPRYAVEVALLDRNVKVMPIDPTDDPANPLHGGHFMIAHTPDVAQQLIGVHMWKMGQQGNFGRYPVHFHMSGVVTGSVISRNLVRNSNQRCYVIHGTHNATISHNIAHDTFGHCFMLEDGIEQNHTIEYNLGSHTKETPDDGILSIAESDMFCSTYWISNPRNFIRGNVAAGSEDTGFWYEMLELVRGPSVKDDPNYEINPSSFHFGYCEENIFHSNKGEGFKLYPNGYFPEERAVFKDNISIKNKGDGILLHNSKNLGIDGGFYADNRMQIEVDKQADDVTVTNAVVVGFSTLYQFEAEAGGLASHCPAHRPISGVQLHSFLRFRDSKGYKLENVTFENFSEDGECVGTTAIEMDSQIRDGHFDAFATFKNLTFESGAPMKEKFNMCWLEAQDGFIGDLAINDLDGSLHPTTPGNQGFIVSNSTFMTTFTDVCVDMEGSCSLFCENVCYHTVNLAVPVAIGYDSLVLEVTETATGKVASFPGYFENKTKIVQNVEVEDVYENYVYSRRRYYSPIVPDGEYTLQFKLDGAVHWPQHAELVWEDPPECSPHIHENKTTFVIPSPTEGDCSNLVRNGGGELGNHDFWMHSGGGIQVHAGGAAGSYAISSDGRNGAWQGPGQFLDVRCLTQGLQYEITAKFKLIDYDGNDVDCDINQKNINAFDVCPRVSFRLRQLLGNTIGDGVDVGYAYPMAESLAPFTSGGWNNIYGVFTVSESMANADAVFMFFERARPGVNIVVDDVVIQPTVQGCSSAIYNGDFESGDTRFWSTVGESKIDIHPEGHAGSSYSLRTTERKQFWSGMTQELNLDCLVEGEQYGLNGMIKLLDENDAEIDCDPSLVWGVNGQMSNICPTLAVKIVTGNLTVEEHIGQVTGPWTSGSWNSFNGLLTATPDVKKADTVTLFFTRFQAGKNIVIDDLTMTPVAAQDPNQLVNNGDGSAGDARYFNIKDGGQIDVVDPGFDGPGDFALVVRGRTSELCGISQVIDNTYLEAGIMYKLGAKVKLLQSDEVTPYDCVPSANYGDKRCPAISLRSQNPMEPPSQRMVAQVQGGWTSGQWNTIEGYITFFPTEIDSGSLLFYVDGPKADVVLVLDDVELTKTTVDPSTAATTS